MDKPELLRHRLVAILAADAVGYSRLDVHQLLDTATVTTLDNARVVFRENIEANRGRRHPHGRRSRWWFEDSDRGGDGRAGHPEPTRS